MDNQLRCVSHEIRNQISVCELYTQILKKTLENKGLHDKNVDNAINCITKSLKLMSNNLTDLKSLDNLNPKRYDINRLVKAGIDLAIVYIEDKDIEISLTCEKEFEVYTDENKFLSCIVNIIKNGIEAIDKKGQINICISDSENDFVSVKISNNGEKISNPDKVFEEGFTTKKTGNGLGLAICKKNMEMLNGELRLNQSDSDITEFEILLKKFTL